MDDGLQAQLEKDEGNSRRQLNEDKRPVFPKS